jgi:hypothetical protein
MNSIPMIQTGPKLNLFNFGLAIHLLNGGVLKTFIDYEKKNRNNESYTGNIIV